MLVSDSTLLALELVRQWLEADETPRRKLRRQLAEHHGPRLQARLASAVEQHRSQPVEITTTGPLGWRAGDVVTISGGTGFMAAFNGTHRITQAC